MNDQQHPPMMPLATALSRIRDTLSPVSEISQQPLENALGLTLAKDIPAPVNLPPADNSAMDGYALASLQPGAAYKGERYLLRGEILAGSRWDGTLAPGECVRIMTGAETPAGTTTVIMQENTHQERDTIVLAADCPDDNNIRPQGDDVTKGTTVLSAGKVLGVGDLGLLGAMGLSAVPVIRPLRVALLATGDELQVAGEPLAAGQIYESNRLTIQMLLRHLPVKITDLGIIPDGPDALSTAFKQAMQQHDLVVSTGGVSVGAADYTRQVLEDLGDIAFWKVAIKPGKPVAFGRLGNGWFFGLPGNPVSALVTAHQLLIPAIERLLGRPETTPWSVRATVTAPFRKKPGRLDFQRALLRRDEKGHYTVEPVSGQGSHMLWSFSQANSYCPLAADSNGLAIGDSVEVFPFMSELTGH